MENKRQCLPGHDELATHLSPTVSGQGSGASVYGKYVLGDRTYHLNFHIQITEALGGPQNRLREHSV